MLQQRNKIPRNHATDSRFEVCGGIASGKTTFAKLTRSIGLEPIFEHFKTNPFWQAFYSDPVKYAFETEITFLLQHYHQIKKGQLIEGKSICCDFSFFLDIAYAEIGLEGPKLKAFLTVYNEIKRDLAPLTLLIYLKCDAKTELERIRNRGRSVENSITIEFLEALNSALDRQVTSIKDRLPVVVIDSALKDFAHDESIKIEAMDTVKNSIKQIAL
jgi:deoxyguanosine kinase